MNKYLHKNKFIICTTINNPTEAIEKYDSMKDWTLIVVTDKKTPSGYKLKNGIVLNVKDQVKLDRRLSSLIGWNCIERRNFGFLLAKKLNADIISTVDDDNIPMSNWGKNILVGQTVNINFYKSKTKVFDPMYVTEYKHLWHRGFPIELLDKRHVSKKKRKKLKIHVQADFWNGDPDIDCIARIMFAPNCRFKKSHFPFISNRIAPFNTQNTFIDGNLLKDYFLFPGVGRMHDIWAAYYLQYKHNINVAFGEASVFQKRNVHTFKKDLKDELIGLKRNRIFIDSILSNKFNLSSFYQPKFIEAFKIYQKHFKN